jgi:hypothetical protein
VSSPSPSQRPTQQVIDQELAIAEHRGAERVRAQVRDVIADRRRVVRHGDHQIEVVEVSAIAEALADEPE